MQIQPIPDGIYFMLASYILAEVGLLHCPAMRRHSLKICLSDPWSATWHSGEPECGWKGD